MTFGAAREHHDGVLGHIGINFTFYTIGQDKTGGMGVPLTQRLLLDKVHMQQEDEQSSP